MGCGLSTSRVSNDGSKSKLAEDQASVKQRRATQHITSNMVHEEYDRDINQFYQIKRTTILGTGVSGTVRICTHLKTGAQFALKTLYKNRIKKKSALDQLRSECRIMVNKQYIYALICIGHIYVYISSEINMKMINIYIYICKLIPYLTCIYYYYLYFIISILIYILYIYYIYTHPYNVYTHLFIYIGFVGSSKYFKIM